MPNRSLFDQFNQVRGTRDFVDVASYRQLAESCGRSYSEGTLTVVSGSSTVTANVSFTLDEQNNFIVIPEGIGAGTYQITSCSGVTAIVIPTPEVNGSSLSYRRHYFQNLEDDLNYLRGMLKLVIGEGDWNADPDTDLRNMAYLIPKAPNVVGQTGAYTTIRQGTVSFILSNIDQSGFVSTGAPSGEYTDNTTSTTAGTSLLFTDDNTMIISIAGGFYPADVGIIRIMRDGAVIGELDLAAAWISNGCVIEESELEVGTNSNYTASNTGTDIINLINRRCMNNSIDAYPSFWPAHQIASMSATMNLPAGFQGQISVVHSIEGSQNYTNASFFVDTTDQIITATAPTVTSGTAVLNYLSGVPYYDGGTTFNVSFTNNSTLFDRGYLTNPVTLNCAEFNASNLTPTLTQLGLTAPLAITTVLGTYNTSITVGASDFRDMDARLTATFRNVFVSGNSANSAAGTFRIDTYGITSTSTVEYFDDENKRFKGTENFNNTSITWADSAWNSTDNVTTLGEKGLQVYNGTLVYPTVNHSTFLPVGPNYTGQSGDFVLYRVFIASAAFTNGTITFSGWADAKSTIQGANVDVYLRYPSCTNYGNNNLATWQNLGVDQTIYGGDGCLGAGSTGSVVAFSFGTTSSVTYGNRIVMKLVFKNSSVTALTGITFSPVL